MSSSSHEPDHPAVITYPPLIYAGGLLLGFILDRLVPLSFLPAAFSWLLGVGLVIASAPWGPLALVEMYRHKTSPLPHDPTTAVVTTGVFRYTRNPIYLTFSLFYLGVTALLNSVWLLALFIPVHILTTRGIIEPEERYLTEKFGAAYTEYRARVRRWL